MTPEPFQGTVPFLSTLKISGNSGFLMISGGIEKKTEPWNGLKIFFTNMSVEC